MPKSISNKSSSSLNLLSNDIFKVQPRSSGRQKEVFYVALKSNFVYILQNRNLGFKNFLRVSRTKIYVPLNLRVHEIEYGREFYCSICGLLFARRNFSLFLFCSVSGLLELSDEAIASLKIWCRKGRRTG